MQPAVTDIRLAAAVTDIWLAAAVTDTWLAGCSCHRQQLAGCLSPGKPLRFKAVFEVTAAAHLSAAHAVRMCATLNHSAASLFSRKRAGKRKRPRKERLTTSAPPAGVSKPVFR